MFRCWQEELPLNSSRAFVRTTTGAMCSLQRSDWRDVLTAYERDACISRSDWRDVLTATESTRAHRSN
jgi:hypothetical protein